MGARIRPSNDCSDNSLSFLWFMRARIRPSRSRSARSRPPASASSRRTASRSPRASSGESREQVTNFGFSCKFPDIILAEVRGRAVGNFRDFGMLVLLCYLFRIWPLGRFVQVSVTTLRTSSQWSANNSQTLRRIISKSAGECGEFREQMLVVLFPNRRLICLASVGNCRSPRASVGNFASKFPFRFSS